MYLGDAMVFLVLSHYYRYKPVIIYAWVSTHRNDQISKSGRSGYEVMLCKNLFQV